MKNEDIVYVRVNEKGYIISINSSGFLTDVSGWIKIDEGVGDKYRHAQGNYFSHPILTDGGGYRYKLVDGAPQECTQEEIQEQEDANRLEPTLSQEERIQILEEELAAAKIILGVE